MGELEGPAIIYPMGFLITEFYSFTTSYDSPTIPEMDYRDVRMYDCAVLSGMFFIVFDFVELLSMLLSFLLEIIIIL